MRSIILATVVTAALFAAGCAARIGYTASVSNEGYGPDLVYAAPGVQVIADYDEPIFYADSFYWRFYGGTWYRSPQYTGGWVFAAPPPAVRRIDQPHAFVHYRPAGWVAHRERVPQQPGAGGHRDDRPYAEPRRVEPAPRSPMYQAPTPRAAPEPFRAAPQPPRAAPEPPRAAPQPPRAAPQPPRAAPQPPRDRDGRDGRGRGDQGDHRDHRN